MEAEQGDSKKPCPPWGKSSQRLAEQILQMRVSPVSGPRYIAKVINKHLFSGTFLFIFSFVLWYIQCSSVHCLLLVVWESRVGPSAAVSESVHLHGYLCADCVCVCTDAGHVV